MIGFVNVFKPCGPTSANVVARMRRIYGFYARDQKIAVGHLGTLDPQAAGVLPIAIGKATRLIPLLTDQRKAYTCTMVVGRSTTSADAHGETMARADVPADWHKRLPAVLDRFTGKIEQTPPMFSAVKHEGQRLYDLARQGITVDRKIRSITVYGISVLGFEGGDRVRLRIACTEGTYVRTLCEDIGAAIGLPAHMGALLREGSGPFILYESLTPEEVATDPHAALIPPENIIPFPTVVLDLRGSADFRAGRVVPILLGPTEKHVFVRDTSRTLVGVGEMHGALLSPRKVFV